MSLLKLNPKITVFIPTLNPGILAKKMVDALSAQTLKNVNYVIVDSDSEDSSIGIFSEINANIISIKRIEYDHGKTRNIAFLKFPADIHIFLTQDAIPENRHSLETLVNGLLMNEDCAMVYGCQLPNDDASLSAIHARNFNYPLGNLVQFRSKSDIKKLGIKTAFFSNSFSAYKFSPMEKLGFFPSKTLFGEDTLAAAAALNANYLVGYVPNARVFHSHNYSYIHEFKRYFDVGAFHAMNSWFMDLLGRAEGEGGRFVASEYEFMKANNERFCAIKVVFRSGIKWLGYKCGYFYSFLPKPMLKYFSMNKFFWVK